MSSRCEIRQVISRLCMGYRWVNVQRSVHGTNGRSRNSVVRWKVGFDGFCAVIPGRGLVSDGKKAAVMQRLFSSRS